MKRLIRYCLNHIPRPAMQRAVPFIIPFLGVFYTGRRVECPICGRRYRKFMPYGYDEMRENAMCPHCMSLERHRLTWLYIVRETDLFTAKPHILHIAPESCFIDRFEKAFGADYITADLESPLAKVKMDVQAIPFPEETFDVIFCSHIMEHVEDDRLAMRELYRVMKRGGWGIVTSPINYLREVTYEDKSITTPAARLAAFRQPDHLRDYGRDYGKRLEEAGFRVEVLKYADKLPNGEIAKYHTGGDSIYVVRK